ncbi:unnamed protein product [Haemonchus placei]|uniref:Mannosyltransferase n=1 Tax=Haemonchus placei TaxID=6290 RepID=A0A0N4X8L2_HAEPC|nr:unnamed protein product [Haemonchus placei]
MLFYASRTLPNTFAFIFGLYGILTYFIDVWKTVMKVRFDGQLWLSCYSGENSVELGGICKETCYRCELVLLFAPIFLRVIVTGRLPLFGWDGALVNGLRTAVKVLGMSHFFTRIVAFSAVTIPLDSLFWGRLVYPEFEVALFNVLYNRSHEYGVHHVLVSTDQLVGSCFLRKNFFQGKIIRYINREKSLVRRLLYYGCCLHIVANLLATAAFLYAGARNYPGGDAIAHLQWTQRVDAQKPISVYVDNACAQTGVSRFMQLYDAWEYNKTETLKPSDMERFDFLMIGTYSGDLKQIVQANYSTHHRVMFAVPAFHRFNIKKTSTFPFYYPEMVFREKVAVLRKK